MDAPSEHITLCTNIVSKAKEASMLAWQERLVARSGLGSSVNDIIGRRYVARVNDFGEHEIEVTGIRFVGRIAGSMYVYVHSDSIRMSQMLFLQASSKCFLTGCPADEDEDCDCLYEHSVDVRRL